MSRGAHNSVKPTMVENSAGSVPVMSLPETPLRGGARAGTTTGRGGAGPRHTSTSIGAPRYGRSYLLTNTNHSRCELPLSEYAATVS